uniref:Uncharacterized protein n=1 Tax=Rhizophora mucronata TaxID=61149 RepID=A0A2P2PWY4_RHIMU
MVMIEWIGTLLCKGVFLLIFHATRIVMGVLILVCGLLK